MIVLVTGADGFIGRHLVRYLSGVGYEIIAASRSIIPFECSNVTAVPLPDLLTPCNWQPILQGCDAVVHLAGIAHRFADEQQYELINHRATEALALAVARQQKHLVFVSSIAVLSGAFSDSELTDNDAPNPGNAYGRSKLAAEESIRSSGATFTILRPVVMYGPGEKGNFAFIHKIARLPIPLPLGALTAQRSILSIQNFNSAVALSLDNPNSRGQTFIVSDPIPKSVPDLIATYRIKLGRSPMLMPIPEKCVELILKMLGAHGIWSRIGRPLVARPTKLLALGWKPS